MRVPVSLNAQLSVRAPVFEVLHESVVPVFVVPVLVVPESVTAPLSVIVHESVRAQVSLSDPVFEILPVSVIVPVFVVPVFVVPVSDILPESVVAPDPEISETGGTGVVVVSGAGIT